MTPKQNPGGHHTKWATYLRNGFLSLWLAIRPQVLVCTYARAYTGVHMREYVRVYMCTSWLTTYTQEYVVSKITVSFKESLSAIAGTWLQSKYNVMLEPVKVRSCGRIV